ncbi:flagellar protein FliT [Hydrogenovibrio kuenenii]|uniref:flagellar protein FliT n=1 Tax=Hydrogenovibrio kuenenii TaxID=63658 RepID=UPI0004657585|nr:flagellar protein FliT [Hydrogenovibrio kuenenii]
MDNQVVQCLHHSKLMLMHVQAEEWDAFISLYPAWEAEINDCLIVSPPQSDAESLKKVLAELIDDIDKIRDLVRGRMTQIEDEFSQAIQQKKAMDGYLK